MGGGGADKNRGMLNRRQWGAWVVVFRGGGNEEFQLGKCRGKFFFSSPQMHSSSKEQLPFLSMSHNARQSLFRKLHGQKYHSFCHDNGTTQ